VVAKQSSHLTSFARTHRVRLPPPTESAWSWQLEGKCLGQPLEVFFPDDQVRSERRRHENAAKRICRECPVLNKCRDHALRTPEPHGIWGAMTPAERTRALLGPARLTQPKPAPIVASDQSRSARQM
jgi:WhiB family transcriptional regulator, redox-sensing transcriptional regulator